MSRISPPQSAATNPRSSWRIVVKCPLARSLSLLRPRPLPLCKMLRQEIRQRLDARGTRTAGRRYQMHRALGLFPTLEDHFDFARGDGVADDEVRQVGNAEAG